MPEKAPTPPPEAIEVNLQVGSIEREEDGQTHDVAYDIAACLRRMTTAHDKAQRLQEQLTESLRQREVDATTIKTLQTQVESLSSENAALKNTVSKSREQIASK